MTVSGGCRMRAQTPSALAGCGSSEPDLTFFSVAMMADYDRPRLLALAAQWRSGFSKLQAIARLSISQKMVSAQIQGGCLGRHDVVVVNVKYVVSLC